MKIVKISDLSEEERKKALEEQEQRYQENEANRKAELKRVADLNTELRIQEKMDKVYNSAPIAENGYTSNKQENKNIWNDLKGVASNFTRSLGNLGINAYENVNRINGEYINQRNKLLEDTNNKYLTKSLGSKGYTEQQTQEIMNNTPTLESIANNSKVLNSITNNANKIIQPMENKFQEWENANNQKIQENIENASNPVSKKILELTPSIAQSSVNLIPGGNVLFSAGITQNYYEDAKEQKGMTDEEASKYASIMATLESGTEMIGARLTKNVGKSLMKGNIKSALANYGLDIGENFLEEAVMEPLGELTTTVVAGEEKANWENIGQRSLQAGIDGAITSVLMGGASAGVGSAVNVVNKISSGQTVTQTEIQTAVKDTQDSRKVDVENIIKNEINNTLNSQQNQIEQLPTAKTIKVQNKVAQNSILEQTESILNNKELPMQSYQYELSDNAKINNLRQDANRYFNNSEKARNYVSMLEKIITDKDIEIRLDGNLKTADGRIANGSYSNGVITINPNSTRAGEFIAIHELTHAIGTKEMINMINTYRQSNTEFDTAVKGLLQNYEGTEISEEALSDISAQLFGNQEFINNIAQNNPNIFQKLYSEIKYLWHQFRGYKNQNQFVEDLYYKWTQAYNNNTTNSKKSSYSIQADSNGNKYVKVDTDQDIFDGINENDYNKIAKMYMQDYLEGKTILSENDVVNVGNKGISKYTNPRQQTKYMTEKMQLSTELKNVLEIAEKVEDSPPTKDTSKYPNWEYYKFKFELGGKNFEGLINIGVDKNGNKHFYEINKIHTTSNSHVSASKSSSTDSINNSIAPTKNDVNTTTKYSIQESENNSGSFSMDNQGRTLTKEQQEYFKDSKIKDRNGLLMTVYHGTNNDFNIFDKQYVSKNTKNAGFYGDGFYFTPDKESARQYGKSSKEVYLDIKNPFSFSELSKYNGEDYYSDYVQIKNLVELNSEWGNIPVKFNDKNTWGDIYEDVKAMLDGNKTDEEIDNLMYDKYGEISEKINDRLYNYSKRNNYKTLSQVLEENGYDGIINRETPENSTEIVAFNSNQIKNVDNINPTDNSDIRYSQNNETWQSYLDKNYKATGTRTSMQDILPTAKAQNNTQNVAPTAENNVLPKAKNIENNKGLNDITHIEKPKTMELPSSEEKAKENKIAKVLLEPVKNQKSKQRTWAILQANLIDKGAVFETLSLKTDNRELQAKYDATLSSGAKGQYAIGNDRYTFENGKKTLQAKSLTSIIDEVGNKVEDFSNYMYHQLNIDRMTLEERFGGDTGINYERKESVKNKPVFGEDITAEYSKQKVEEYENKYPEFKKYAKDIYDYLDANKAELVKNGVISQELSDKFKEMYPHYVPIARINTNNNNIAVPLDTYRTGINNPIKRAKGGSSDIQPLFNTIADRTLQTYRASARNAFGVELKNTLEKNNLLNAINENTDIDTIIDTMADEQQTGLTEGTKYKNPTFTVFENGEKVTYDINLDMYDALKPQNELITKINDSKLSKAVNKISNIRRGLLTEYNPLFSITNSIKDAQDVLQNSQHALKTYRKFPEAYAQIMQKGYWYNEYIQNGGEQNSYFKDGNFELNDNLPKAKKAITMPLKVISKMNNVIEMAPRLAEYIASRESGKSIQTSMLDASRVTTNFKAGGDITKALNRNGATFLNAGVQGMAQQVRNIREAHAKGLKGYAVLATKTILAGMPALILNNLVWDDDEEYENLQDYVKDSYYIVGKIGDNQFIRIPKGRTTAVIQKLFTTADKYITDGKEINIDNFAEDFWTNLLFAKDNIAPNNPIDNNILAPMVQAVSNKTWYGEDLVPSRLKNVPKAEQYDETTDIFSKWVGEKLNISPIKINYVLDQYGGGLSDVLLPLSTPQAENNPIEDKFTTNSVMKSKYPGEFFEKIDELEINSNSSKATDEDKLKYKYISDISKETSDLYKEKREIQNSTLTDKEKKNKLIEVQKQINSLAKEALEKVDTIKVNGNTATINKNKYYKTTDIKDNTKIWKKLSDEEVEKNKNISLSTYADYKEKVAQETIKQRKSGNIKEDGSIKDKDKMSILINSNYSNKEKQAIYENYIKDANDKKYNIVKTTGIDINKYLEYKSKGLTTKDARYNYIENMQGTTYMQKIILFGLENAPSYYDKKTIVNYINTLPGKTQSEKQEMLKSFSWYK